MKTETNCVGRFWSIASIATFACVTLSTVGAALNAATLYWKTTGQTWQSNSNWAPNLDGTGSTPPPVSTDDVYFNSTGANATTEPRLGGTRTVTGVTIVSTGNVDFRHGSSSGISTLAIGIGGINMTGSTGRVTFGDSSGGQKVHVQLNADQSWINDRTGTSGSNTGILVRDDVYPSGDNRILTLGGSNTATASGVSGNTINGSQGTIRDNGGLTLAIVKTGTGTWRIENQHSFSGGVTLTDGTLEILGSSTPTSGVVTSGPLGTGVLTLNGGRLLSIGAAGSNALGNDVTLLNVSTNRLSANTGTTTYNGVLSGAGGFTKSGSGVVELTNSSSYFGNTTVEFDGATGALKLTNASSSNIIPNSPVVTVDGILDVTGLQNSTFNLSSGQILAGTGFVNGIVGGSGLVQPGASPGILSTVATDAASGLDFAFEMTAIGEPNWSSNANSINDVLRLIDPATPFSSALDLDNTVTVNFAIALNANDVIYGGFYTDLDSDFSNLVTDADWQFTFTDGSLPSGYMIAPSVTQVTSADFISGTVLDGWVTTFTVVPVPEPSGLILTALSMMGLAAFRARVRR